MEYLLIFLVNLIYFPAIWYGLVSDDALDMVLNPHPMRPAKIYSIILHLCVCEYIYIAFGCTPASFMAAILFSVHPFAVQVPVWYAGRSYGANALVFLMVLAYMPWGVLAYPLSYAHSGCASLILTPLCFLFTKYWFFAFLTPILIWYSWKNIMIGVQGKIKGDGWLVSALPKDFDLLKKNPRKIVIVLKTIWYYAFGCLLPIKNGFYNSYLQTFSVSKKHMNYWYSFNRHFWGGLLSLIILSCAWWMNRHNMAGFGLLLFGFSLVPFLNFITVQQFTSPRYAYLPLIGYLITLATLLSQFGIVGLLIMAGLFVFYLERLTKVLPHYKKDNATLYELDTQVFPDNPRLWYFRAGHWNHKGNFIMSWAESTYGLMHLPEDCQLWFNLACASFGLGHPKEASIFLDNAEKFMMLADRDDMTAVIKELRGRIQEALGLTRTHIDKQPFYRNIPKRF